MFQIILMTHEDLGEVYLRCATRIFGDLPAVSSVSVSPRTPSGEILCHTLEDILGSTSDRYCEETLILVDLFGATPCNGGLIFQAQHHDRVKVVSGLNFPMLLKALTVRDLPLHEAVEVIIEAGKMGIFDATTEITRR